MAFARITLPDGTKLGDPEKGVYYSTLDDLKRQLFEIEGKADKVDDKDPAGKRKIESVNHEFVVRFATDPAKGLTRDQLTMDITVKAL